uniref:Lachesin n=1 Tax=Cacopsylla melanoneura TaxID=428564 RepID=A0A8D8ZRN9_9HEMI
MSPFSLSSVIGVCVLVSFVTCQRSPTISYISQEQIKDIAQTADLKCSVQYADEYPVIWMKMDTAKKQEPLPISMSGSLIIHDSRFQLTFDSESSTYMLSIKEIQETDAGIYKCEVIISLNNKVSAEVELIVRRPPVISDNSTRSVIVSEGQSVNLYCYANGYPQPTISWRRDNSAALSTGGSIYRGNMLHIPNITKTDRGTYYCVAQNGVGRGFKRNIAVEVEFAPVITINRPRQGQALQYDAILECHVEAYPPPAIVWIKDGQQIMNNQHYSVSHFANSDEFADTSLRVITIERRQFGQYSCKAANKYGSAQKDIELFETIVPVCPPAC